jgi:hypothetical protein
MWIVVLCVTVQSLVHAGRILSGLFFGAMKSPELQGADCQRFFDLKPH